MLKSGDIMSNKGMFNKFVLAIVAIFLISAVGVMAYQWGYTKYGAVYYEGQPYFSYYPVYYAPTYGMYYPSAYSPHPAYSYPYAFNPISSENMYRYGFPSTYTAPPLVRSGPGNFCGIIDSTQLGCEFGLVCDYTKGNQPGVGMCVRQTATTTYPYQVDTGSVFYYG